MSLQYNPEHVTVTVHFSRSTIDSGTIRSPTAANASETEEADCCSKFLGDTRQQETMSIGRTRPKLTWAEGGDEDIEAEMGTPNSGPDG